MEAASAEPRLWTVRGVARREIDQLRERHRVEVPMVNGPERLVLRGGVFDLASYPAHLAACGARQVALDAEAHLQAEG
jgi:hypothetical protein